MTDSKGYLSAETLPREAIDLAESRTRSVLKTMHVLDFSIQRAVSLAYLLGVKDATQVIDANQKRRKR